MIDTIKKIFGNNYEWIFSGVGVYILGVFFAGLAIILGIKHFKNTRSIKISTKGDKSPGIVGGDYRINSDD